MTAASTARHTIGNHKHPVSDEKITNRLREAGIRACRPMKAPVVLRRHHVARLAWARRHLRFTRADWANVLFVDESKIVINGIDGRLRVYRRAGERANGNCIVETQQFGGGSILVWTGSSMHTKIQIVRVNGNLNARRYQTDIITPVLFSHSRANRGIIVAQDSAPCHAARTTQHMLHANNVRMLPWPSCSPDLFPTEHVWDLLKRCQRELPSPHNLAQLERIIWLVWRNIAQATIQNYIGSMRRRCQAVCVEDTLSTRTLELMFMKHYAPNRCLYIKVAKLRTGVGSAEMSHLQNCSLKIYFKRVLGWVGFGGGGVRMDENEELKFL